MSVNPRSGLLSFWAIVAASDFAPTSAAAQQRSSAAAQQQNEQLWLQVNTVTPLGDDFRLTLEQIARFSDRQEGLFQTEFDGLVEHRATKNIELGLGYRRVDFHNPNITAGEHRLRQHIVATHGPLTTRLRIKLDAKRCFEGRLHRNPTGEKPIIGDPAGDDLGGDVAGGLAGQPLLRAGD